MPGIDALRDSMREDGSISFGGELPDLPAGVAEALGALGGSGRVNEGTVVMP